MNDRETITAVNCMQSRGKGVIHLCFGQEYEAV